MTTLPIPTVASPQKCLRARPARKGAIILDSPAPKTKKKNTAPVKSAIKTSIDGEGSFTYNVGVNGGIARDQWEFCKCSFEIEENIQAAPVEESGYKEVMKEEYLVDFKVNGKKEEAYVHVKPLCECPLSYCEMKREDAKAKEEDLNKCRQFVSREFMVEEVKKRKREVEDEKIRDAMK